MESFNTFLEEGLLDPLLQYLVKPTETENEYKLNVTTDNESKHDTDDEEIVIKGTTRQNNDSETDDKDR